MIPDVPDGWLRLAEAAKAFGASRHSVLGNVQGGELHALHVSEEKSKGLRIAIRRPAVRQFEQTSSKVCALLTTTAGVGHEQVVLLPHRWPRPKVTDRSRPLVTLKSMSPDPHAQAGKTLYSIPRRHVGHRFTWTATS